MKIEKKRGLKIGFRSILIIRSLEVEGKLLKEMERFLRRILEFDILKV